MTPEEQNQKIDAFLARLERAAAENLKMWEKLDRLAALASAHADRQLLVLNRIEKNTDSNNRVAEQLTFTRQKLTESLEQREYIRAGLDQLRTELATHFAVVGTKLDGVDSDFDKFREQSGAFPLITPEDVRADALQRGEALKLRAAAEAEAIKTTAEAEAKALERDPWFSRIFIVIFKGNSGAQVTAVLLALIAAIALILGGAQTIRSLWPGSAPPAPAAKPAAESAAKGAAHAEP